MTDVGFSRRSIPSWILSEIDKQLKQEPKKETRNRKPLPNVSPDFEFDPPLWELRVGDYRVFYDVNEADETVRVHAVRWKGRVKTTREVLHEEDDD